MSALIAEKRIITMLIPKISLNTTQNQTTFSSNNLGFIPRNRREYIVFVNDFRRFPELRAKAEQLLVQRGFVSPKTLSKQFAALMLEAIEIKAARASAPYEAGIVAIRNGERI